jgi:hypothetical protein
MSDDLKHLTPLQRREVRMLRTLLDKARDRELLAKEKHDAATIEREGYEERLHALVNPAGEPSATPTPIP